MSGGKNKAFMADPIAFMRKYSVAPADNVQNDIGDKAGRMPTTASNEDYVFSNMPAGSRIAWLNFAKRPRGSGRNDTFAPASEGGVTVDGSFHERDGKVKSYFLPWTAGGGIIQLAIPAMGPLNPDSGVKYFFTATITGCSIFIKGTAQAPVIFHAGGQTGQANPGMAAQFWRALMAAHAGGGGPIVGEVNKTDYVSQLGLGGPAAPATAHSQTFEAWLRNAAPADLNISWTFPWGCVMGLRAPNGDWAFYLQENVTIFFSKFTKKHWYSSSKTVQGTVAAAARPMLFRQFFPGGLAHANFVPSMPRRI
jgi:hypothetical protein